MWKLGREQLINQCQRDMIPFSVSKKIFIYIFIKAALEEKIWFSVTFEILYRHYSHKSVSYFHCYFGQLIPKAPRL